MWIAKYISARLSSGRGQSGWMPSSVTTIWSCRVFQETSTSTSRKLGLESAGPTDRACHGAQRRNTTLALILTDRPRPTDCITSQDTYAYRSLHCSSSSDILAGVISRALHQVTVPINITSLQQTPLHDISTPHVRGRALFGTHFPVGLGT